MNKRPFCTTIFRNIAVLVILFLCGISARAQVPANDLPAGAITITVDQPCILPYTNAGAVSSAGEPGAFCSGDTTADAATVWFKFTAPASGAVQITNDFAGNTIYDSRVALYSAGNVADFTTFTSLACDDNNGITGSGYNCILYAAGLSPNTEYYIAVDNSSPSAAPGTFCLEVNTLNAAMLPDTASCSPVAGNGATNNYRGWLSLVTGEGKLVANVRPNAGSPALGFYDITASLNIHQGMLRHDANGQSYLDRSSFYEGYIADADYNQLSNVNMDLQLFFSQAELTESGTALASLNVTHNPGTACAPDFSGSGSQTVLTATASGATGTAGWVNVTTPGFSNFYLMGGTTPLSLNLKSITAVNAGRSNRIDWSTFSEYPGGYFELERSADGRDFVFLARINTKGMAPAYTWWDHAPFNGASYYRLKIIGEGGKKLYSNVVVAVNQAGEPGLIASPNPVKNMLKLSVPYIHGRHAFVFLDDITGRRLYDNSVTSDKLEIDMRSLPKGLYLLRYTDGSRTSTIKISKE